jgi:hypothetical protein
MVPTFERCPSSETEASEKLFNNHMAILHKQLSLYSKYVSVSKFEWVRNPFAAKKFPD